MTRPSFDRCKTFFDTGPGESSTVPPPSRAQVQAQPHLSEHVLNTIQCTSSLLRNATKTLDSCWPMPVPLMQIGYQLCHHAVTTAERHDPPLEAVLCKCDP